MPDHDIKSLARSISLVENEVPGYEDILKSIPHIATPVIGITGPPGAGKSTLTNELIKEMVKHGKQVAVLCVDPSSPFNLGALLGDRIRMSEWYNNPNVFIRSLASRGALGGLHPKIIELTDLVKTAVFDYIIIETVGVGQSEIEIAGLADITVVVLVPESGDEVQAMKSGLMEIADIFVVNKSDRPAADLFMKNLQLLLSTNHKKEAPAIVKTIASQGEGVEKLFHTINERLKTQTANNKKEWLLTEKAFHLIQHKRMKDIDKLSLKEDIKKALGDKSFNLYAFVEKW
ncbi:methylmalonyl Co-A mutase-associated GTPase MeaB [Pinibacter aurantiacus]|uniref:Methylmalonyl Co-A mutase-associated GTPase MeaB n=1 Tax=Pinibacter aurantiacus TaxID=2851599 RepID=A0A9E2W423_9BACT|nr:methylmalonyl Co-A mutase-associated GTPase MeaB [Pinibacter aurantiacus]MBV4359175.1 methylmalonyl Co-A mutase-associated GTPase MeaB [Pinibacter aurantiacus]